MDSKRSGKTKTSKGKFPFSPETIFAAKKRQLNRCAMCAKPLLTQAEADYVDAHDQTDETDEISFSHNEASHAHHVFPQQAGDPSNPKHAWIASLENCVVIHEKEHIHRAHGGNTRTGPVAIPESFPYSHNIMQAHHQEWVRNLKEKADPIWESIAAGAKRKI